MVAFPAETTEAFLEGHVRAFAYFGGVPTRILYDLDLQIAELFDGYAPTAFSILPTKL